MILFGIFNLKSIENTKEYNYLYDNLNNQNKLEDVSGDRKKSFTLCFDKQKGIKGYISNIGTKTMLKRMIV